MKEIIIADIKNFVTDGTIVGHYFAVAENYNNLLGAQIGGGQVYIDNNFKNVFRLPWNTCSSDTVFQKKIKMLLNLKCLFSESKDKIVILQSSGIKTSFWGIKLFKKKHTKLVVLQYSIDSIDNPIKYLMYKLTAMNKIDGMISTKEDVAMRFGRPYCILPDYIYCTSDNKIEVKNKKYDLGMIGIISYEKGTLEVLRKFRNTNVRILCAGKPQDEHIRREIIRICEGCDNIVLDLRYLSNDEFKNYIKECRYCVLNYKDTYSNRTSGIVYDSVFNGVPIIAQNCRAVSFIAENNLGYIYEDLNELDEEMIFDRDRYNIFLDNFENYFRKNQEYKNDLVRFLEGL